MNGRPVVTLAGALACLVLGFLVARLTGGEPTRVGAALNARRASASDAQAGTPAPPSGADGAALESPAPGAEARQELIEDGYFSAALLAYFEEEFCRSWATLRDLPPSRDVVDASRGRFEEVVLALPAGMGKEAAGERQRSDSLDEAFQEGDGVALVEACAESDLRLSVEQVDDELFDRVFRPRVGGPRADGPEFGQGEATATDGMLLEFGPGIHTLEPDRLWKDSHKAFPTDLTLVGAGRDRTLLSLDYSFTARTEIQRLSVRDLTLDCADNYLFDVRRSPVTVDLEGVRVVRFDMGAGSSLVFGTSEGLLVRARRCEFLEGYGRHPGSGNLFRGAALIALFQDCLFRRVDLNVDRTFDGHARFVDCVFEQYSEDPTGSFYATFEGAVVRPLMTRDELRGLGRVSLAELFAGWRER